MTEQTQKKIFNRWLSEHKALLFKVVRAYADALNDQDDLFQEIAVQVWRSVPNFKGDSKETTWMYRVALNTAMNWKRKEDRNQPAEQRLDDHIHVLTLAEEPEDERLDWLYQQISKMDEPEKSITLLLLDGYSYKEIAGIIGISESNVGVKIHRVKQQLIQQSKNTAYHGV